MSRSYSTVLREKWIAGNLAEYGDAAASLHWIDPNRSWSFEERRARILESLGPALSLIAKQTKPHLGALAPGCRICTQGAWSCLFINGRCNCRCFYCPGEQNEIGLPTTNRIPFGNPEEYSDYVQRFGFAGVSMSGGEPLLTFERTIDYIAEVRKRMGADLHIWMYTNGTLVTRQRLQKLRQAGLKEIRFDISAVDYDLSKARLAADLIPCVTVEIPAIPEDFERLTRLLPEMERAGVSYLNLHQLRLTPHNRANLAGRRYTYLHGESVTVLESELSALALLEHAAGSNLKLPINYCSFVYKRRFQQAAARRRSARAVMKGCETLTESGFIRTLALAGASARLAVQAERLQQGAPPNLWSLGTTQERLTFHPSLWPLIDDGSRLLLTYSEAALAPGISYRHFFKELRLAGGKKIYVEKRPMLIELEADESTKRFIANLAADAKDAANLQPPDRIAEFECIRSGMQEYY